MPEAKEAVSSGAEVKSHCYQEQEPGIELR